MGHEWVEVTDGLRFPEGPVAMADGSVLVVEIAAGAVTRVRPDGTKERVADVAGPNGAAIGPDGALYVCDNGAYFSYEDTDGIVVPHAGAEGWRQGAIVRVDLDSGDATTLYTHCGSHRLLAPNDIVFDRHGGCWVTDHGVHGDAAPEAPCVVYALADGSSIVPAVTGLDATNGVGLSPDSSVLYVTETYRGRLLAFDVVAPGELGNPAEPRVLHDAGGAALFDSLAVAADGGVCVATLLTGGITTVSPDGADVAFVETGDPVTTNIAFGGDDRRTAFVTLSGTGRLVRTRWPVAGAALAHEP